MGYAPVVVFSYNRYAEIMRIMEALGNNIGAKDTDVFIYSNAPVPEMDGDVEKVKRIRMDLRKFSKAFHSYQIIERKENKGPNENMMYGIQEVLSRYDRVIILEDDILTARNFLAFMNQALDTYENDDEVFSICGYNPVDLPLEMPGDTFAYDAFRSWGWATWKNRWQSFDIHEDTLSRINLPKVHSEGLMYISCIRNDIIWRQSAPSRYLDFKLACKQMADGKTVIYSKESLCDNIGMTENSVTSLSDDTYRNNNFLLDNTKLDFVFSKEKLSIKNSPDYFFCFRDKEFAMKIYFSRNFDRNVLYHNMYYALSFLYFKGYSIGYFFHKHGVKEIAIYGWGESGQYLYELVKKDGIAVLYAMDRNEFPDEKRLVVYHNFENLLEIDMVVVSAIQAFSKIEEKIQPFFKCPIVSMDDVVAECKVDLIDNNKG